MRTEGDDEYLDALADELGWPTWDEAMEAAAWRSGWRWCAVLVGLVLTCLPVGIVIGYIT